MQLPSKPRIGRKPIAAGQVKTERISLVVSVEELREVDEWRRAQPDLPSRSEAIRRLVEKALKARRA